MSGQAPAAEAMRAAKKAVRKAVEAKIASISEGSKETQSQQVYQKLMAHPAFARSRAVAVYLSTPSEVDTRPVVAALLGSGRACFVPRYAHGTAREAMPNMQMVRLRDMNDYHNLPTTPWGIPQPALDERRPTPGQDGEPPLDLVLVPGVAFTASGDRLGHGMGFYDKYLSTLPEPKPTAIALAFREQLVDGLPTTDGDYTLDGVLTADAE